MRWLLRSYHTAEVRSASSPDCGVPSWSGASTATFGLLAGLGAGVAHVGDLGAAVFAEDVEELSDGGAGVSGRGSRRPAASWSTTAIKYLWPFL
jgi:hypothetical protein